MGLNFSAKYQYKWLGGLFITRTTAQADKQQAMTRRLPSLIRHSLLWTAFMGYESGTLYLCGKLHGAAINHILFYAFNIGFFYLNAQYVLPLACRRPKKPLIVSSLLVLGECLAYLASKFLLDYGLANLEGLRHDELLSTRIYLIGNLWRCASFLAFSSIYYSYLANERYYRRLMAAQKRQAQFYLEKAQLENDYAAIENAFLQQQIHPHFLFNALNFIYSSFYPLSETAANCVAKLSDIFRYSLKGTGDDGKAELLAEIKQIQNFIEINRLRFAYPIYIDLQLIGNFADQRIIPLVLLSFVENIFKYGTIKEKLWPVQIVIELKAPNELIFTCHNLKNNRAPGTGGKSIGIGNTVKRLDFSYPNRYQLTVRDEEDTFGVALEIEL